MIRISGGSFKGRVLKTIDQKDLKPTKSIIREAIFNIIGSHRIQSKTILDLYAGAGTIGLEALSRGASFCCFVEKNPKIAECLTSNISLCKVEKQSHVITQNIMSILPSFEKYTQKTFNLIFMDPPYQKYPQHLLFLLIKHCRIDLETIFIAEHDSSIKISYPTELSCFLEKKYGRTNISFFSQKN